MSVNALLLNGRKVKPHKAVIGPLLGTRNVLTHSPWGFVSLWLQREGKTDALFFWNQAQEFHRVSVSMPPESAPLLHYYCFMNAAKALLTAKSVQFSPYHGVKGHDSGGVRSKISLANRGIRIMANGVLPALSAFLGETETSSDHTLQELLFNLPYVHRTYCLTYRNQADLFLPLVGCEFALDDSTMEVYFRAELSEDFSDRKYMRRLPATLRPDPQGASNRSLRSQASVAVTTKDLHAPADLRNLSSLNRDLRFDLQYINGAHTLWYVKSIINKPRRLARFPLTLTLAAMHRLSEMCRYHPMQLTALLAGQSNWLLSEFIQAAPNQFLDEVASEITGHQFLVPNVRTAT